MNIDSRGYPQVLWFRPFYDSALKAMSCEFGRRYCDIGRPSMAPGKLLLRPLLLQILYTVRSKRMLMEQL